MIINIDDSSGFCWGVVRTVDIVEDTLKDNGSDDVYVLGQIIHNPREIERLESVGMKTINLEDLGNLNDNNIKVIVRAHGEPPSTFKKAAGIGIELIDATCPLVTGLQKKVRNFHKRGFDVVIYGKPDHAEIIGLRGVIDDDCIVVQSAGEAMERISFSNRIVLLSQTTKDKKTLYEIKNSIEKEVVRKHGRENLKDMFQFRDTLCKEVWGREEILIEFAKSHDIILFVAGKKSSNGKSLYRLCRKFNKKTHFVEHTAEIEIGWFDSIEKIGITGATSTPLWYLESIREELTRLFKVHST